MPQPPVPWFVAERGEALAGLLLTARDDVRIESVQRRDDGADFLVGLATDAVPSTRLFWVHARGTTSTDPAVWRKATRPLFRHSGSRVHFPVCVWVIDVRGNKAVSAWAAEPVVTGTGATLRTYEEGSFEGIDREAVGDLIERVRAWYEAGPTTKARGKRPATAGRGRKA